MKKLLKNKKVLTITAMVVTMAIIAAGSYAWFTGSAAAGLDTTMGRLNVSASVEDLLNEPNYYYEPGDYVSLEYSLDNVHEGSGNYLTAFVKADFAYGQVVINSDIYGNEVASYTMDIDPATVQAMCDVKTVIDPDTYLLSAWYVDRTTGTYYALIDAGMSAEANVEIEFVGGQMGNMYQDSKFSFTGEFPYTQVKEAAIADVFGLDLNNLDPVDENGNILYSSGMGRSMTRDFYMNLLYDALDR